MKHELLYARDLRKKRDGYGAEEFEVRSSRFSELRTEELPFAHVLPAPLTIHPQALPVVLALSSNNEHGTVRVLHHPRRNAPEEKPGDGAQPFGPHHDQIGMLFGRHLHDLFSRLPKLTHEARP